MGGCEVDSFFDPSKTGYFERTAISTPILERIDVIERDGDVWSNATPPTPADLLPSDLEYRLVPGDTVIVQVLGLMQPGLISEWPTQVDQSGNVRLPPPLRDFPAAGLTLRQLEDEIADFLDPEHIRDPFVVVNLTAGSGLTYTVMGQVPGPNIYQLRRPDLRLLDALALAGGAAITTETILVIRTVPLVEEMREPFERPPTGEQPQQPPPNIEDILDQLERGRGDDDEGDEVNLGVITQDQDPFVDIDELGSQPRWLGELPADVSAETGRTVSAAPLRQDSFVWVAERNEWVAIQQAGGQPPQDLPGEVLPGRDEERMVVERVIKIPYQKLLSDSHYNIVIRPGDRIYVQPPDLGVVYIEGEVFRPGVYSLPGVGRLTLSRLVTAAGGFAPLAIPNRVDLIRRTGPSREATIRLSVAAIRQRNEPDIFLKADDHVIIGTNFWAAPLAVIRNGFRATYGFGFLLDRNFGSDVFGAPPREGIQGF